MLSKLMTDLYVSVSTLADGQMEFNGDKKSETNQQVRIPFFAPRLLHSPWLLMLST